MKTAVLKMGALVLGLVWVAQAWAASPCETYDTELGILDLKIVQSTQRLSEVETLLKNAQTYLDAVSNAMAAVLSGNKYSMMDSMILIRHCKDAVRPVGTLNPTHALSCINDVLQKMIKSKREVAKLVDDVRAEDRDLRNQMFRLRERQAAAGCATEESGRTSDAALPPRDTSALCAEKWAGRRAIRARLEGIRAEYDGRAKELALAERIMDQLTSQAAAVQAGDWHEMTLPSTVLACAGYFTQDVTPAKVAACFNDYIGSYLKEVRAHRSALEILREKDSAARREASTIRDIAAEMKCPEPPPLDVPPLPELAPLKEPKPPTLSQPGATTQGNAAAFVGQWTGTVTVTAASEPSAVGISETGTLELFAAGTGIGVKTRLGVIGNPAAYQVKVSDDRLQIHYAGPSHTTATPGIPATLDYTLDVTRNGDQLTGESHSKATSTYRGHTAVVSFTQKMTLHR
jgi:hypothetical protein